MSPSARKKSQRGTSRFDAPYRPSGDEPKRYRIKFTGAEGMSTCSQSIAVQSSAVARSGLRWRRAGRNDELPHLGSLLVQLRLAMRLQLLKCLEFLLRAFLIS